MRKRIYLLILTAFVIFSIGFILIFIFTSSSRKITFEDCANAGGEAWLVDLYHPDICPDCNTYHECVEKNGDHPNIFELCPQVTTCSDCLSSNHPYPDKCPDGKQKIGEIMDAAIWFQCCK
jgi:hypothetical protein